MSYWDYLVGARIEHKNEIILKNIIKDHYSISIKKAKLDNFMYKINIESYDDY